MQRPDQFRNFFPGHTTIDRAVQSEEANRRRSQLSSSSQSQDYRSQSTFHQSSFTNSGSESQASVGNRYEDILASGRHLEMKDQFDGLRKTLGTLSGQVSAQQASLVSTANQLNSIYQVVNEIKAEQDNHDKILLNISAVLTDLKQCIQDSKSPKRGERARHTTSPISNVSASEDELDTSSQDGMSVGAYMTAKKARKGCLSLEGQTVSYGKPMNQKLNVYQRKIY